MRTAHRIAFAAAADRAHLVEAITAESEHLVFGEQPRLAPMVTIVLVPASPGVQRLTPELFGRLRAAVDEQPMLGWTSRLFQHVRLGGPGLVLLSTDLQQPEIQAVLHADGTGAWTRTLKAMESHTGDGTLGIDADELVHTVLSALFHLGRHAAAQGASGTAHVRVTLTAATAASVGRDAVTLMRQSMLGSGFDIHHPIATVSRRRAHGQGYALVGDLADGTAAMVAAAALMLADLVQHFGLVEAEQVTLDGGLRASAWGGRPREPVLKWAAQEGLDVGV
ncbi:hypothetical protein [Streptodolium elevatio]|uniref:Uncharacterized protein n=1 Tax=Streptodolium elevatio TaxID=3157996 RepID=A0ABV3DU99_9ACTN